MCINLYFSVDANQRAFEIKFPQAEPFPYGLLVKIWPAALSSRRFMTQYCAANAIALEGPLSLLGEAGFLRGLLGKFCLRMHLPVEVVAPLRPVVRALMMTVEAQKAEAGSLKVPGLGAQALKESRLKAARLKKAESSIAQGRVRHFCAQTV